MTQLRKESLNLRNLPTLKSKNRQNKKSHTHPSQNMQETWGNYKRYNNICIMEISEKEGTEEIFEPIRPENFHQLMLETQPQTDEAQKTPRTINVKKKKKNHNNVNPIQTSENQR